MTLLSLLACSAFFTTGCIDESEPESQTASCVRETLTAPNTILVRDSAGNPLPVSCLAIQDERILAGIPGLMTRDTASEAYAFKKSDHGFNQQAVMSFGDNTDRFMVGTSIAVDGKHCAIGAMLPYPATKTSGLVRIFESAPDGTLQPSADLTAPKGWISSTFGGAVAIEGSYCVVGASSEITGETITSGRVYVFHQQDSLWKLEATIEAPEGQGLARFGMSVDIMYPYIAVSAGEAQGVDSRFGVSPVLLFKQHDDSWIADGVLQPTDDDAVVPALPVAFQFHDNALWIGAGTANNGFALVQFKRSNDAWVEVGRASHRIDRPEHPISMALDGEFAVVGSYQDKHFVAHVLHVDVVEHRLEQLAEFQAAAATGDGVIGLATALHGDTIVIAEGGRQATQPRLRVLSLAKLRETEKE